MARPIARGIVLGVGGFAVLRLLGLDTVADAAEAADAVGSVDDEAPPAAIEAWLAELNPVFTPLARTFGRLGYDNAELLLGILMYPTQALESVDGAVSPFRM